MDEWQELDQAKKQRQEQEERARLDRAALRMMDPAAGRSERALQIHAIQEKIEPFQEKIEALAEKWNRIVSELLAEIATATWGENRLGASRWAVTGKVVWSDESQTPSLYWEALLKQTYLYAWYAVELRTDLEAQPVRFVVTCKEATFTISADVAVDALKSALVTAFKLGPMDNIFPEDTPGIPIE